MDNFDALFEQYADKADEEAKASSRGTGYTSNYETINWTGLEAHKPLVFRAVGGPPDSNVTPYTAKTCMISWIVGDDGKKFKVVKPSLSADPNYIINRIIAKINQVKWVNNEKTYPVKEKFPELYNMIEKNGLQEGDKRYIFERGWKGKEVLIMNVIDRARMEEHRASKHTMLLAKSITQGQGDTEFVDEGIPAYGVLGKFSHLFRAYGAWDKYDIAITKTGVKENPYTIVNATHSPFEVARDYQKYNISNNNFLTDEEKSWETYDLSKIYKTTSVIKIYNRLRNTIKKIDYALGTNFYEELETEYKVEKKRLDEENERAEIEASKKENTTVEVMTNAAEPVIKESTEQANSRVRSRGTADSSVAVTSNEKPGSNLPYYESLSDSVKEMITDAKPNPTTQYVQHWDIDWNCDQGDLASCEVCGTLAPYDGVTKCPACGLDFEA